MDSPFQCLTSLQYYACVGTGFHLHWATDPSLYCQSSHIAMPVAFHLVLTVSSLLWTLTPFPIFLPKDMLAKTCCHCTHKERNWIGLTSWEHGGMSLCVWWVTGSAMSVWCRLCVAQCITAWWDISVCVTRRKWEMKMAVEGKMRWNNNQQSCLQTEIKGAHVGFCCENICGPKMLVTLERKENRVSKSNCWRSLWRSSEEKGEMYENFG